MRTVYLAAPLAQPAATLDELETALEDVRRQYGPNARLVSLRIASEDSDGVLFSIWQVPA